MKTPIALVASGALLLAASDGTAQNSDPGNLRVYAVGGFLGQVEGFCEAPGGPYDWTAEIDALPPCGIGKDASRMRALGGVLGAANAIPDASRRRDSDWVLVPSNNQPAPAADSASTLFDQQLLRLAPDAVAIGAEDLDRRLRSGGQTAQGIAEWIRRNTNIPLLASNIAIRRTAEDLNVTEDNHFELHLDEDTSVDWLADVKFDFPSTLPAVNAYESQACQPGQRASIPNGTSVPVTVNAVADGEATLTFTNGMRPGRCYVLQFADGRRSATLHFVTDESLTPIASRSESLNGLPLVTRTNRPEVAIALVDPATVERAATRVWRWDSGGSRYQLRLADPSRTAKWLIAAARTAGGPLAAPIVLLLSSLSDAGTAAVLAEFAEIRVVVLGPDSGLLGRAAPRQAGPGGRPVYSGDLGFGGVVDEHLPAATRLFLRPEWFGETVVTAHAALARGDPAVLKNPVIGVTVVGGPRLGWTSDDLVTYRTRDAPIVQLGSAKRYADCPPSATDGRCTDFRNIWTTPESVAVVVADAVRHRIKADLAVVSTDLVDPDFHGWVAGEIESSKDATWLSRYILERLIYISPRMVRAYVSGAELPATLARVAEEDPASCIAGLGAACGPVPDDAHAEEVTVNGRRIDRRLIYSIALPDALAETLNLPHSDDARVVDLLAAADDHLVSGQWWIPAQDAAAPLSDRVERRLSRRWSGYLAVNTFDFGFAEAVPDDPSPEAADVRENLPIEFAGAKRTRSRTLSFDADFAPFDATRAALRFPVTFEYAENRQEETVSFNKDFFSAGVRLDFFKVHVLGDLRPFVGWFVDGPFRTHRDQFTPSRELQRDGDFVQSERATFRTTRVIEPSHYRHRAVGADVMGLRRFVVGAMTFTPTTVGFRWAWGEETRAVYGIAVGGLEQPVGTYFSGGASGVLTAFLQEHRAELTRETTLDLLTRRQRQERPQFDARGTISFTPKETTYSADVVGQLRWYRYDGVPPTDFALRSSQKFEIKFRVPLVRRLTITPEYSFQRARIHAVAQNTFSYQRIGIGLSVPVLWRWGHGSFIR